jgi:DNA-directed RNA polymerase subunit beta'
VARFVDLISGISVREETDEATGMTQKIVSDWRSAPKGNDLKPEIIIMDPATGEPVRNDRRQPDHLSDVGGRDPVGRRRAGHPAGDVVARIPREGAKTKDITGGLPRVAELFEARRPKDHAIIAETDGYVRFGKDYKNKRRITVEPVDETLTPVEYMIPKGKHIPVQEGDFVQKGDYIMDGNPAPHDILRIMGVEALANYMIDEVQDVYRLQGVKINDKHIEVIVRQMLQKFEILDSGRHHAAEGRTCRQGRTGRGKRQGAKTAGMRPAVAEPILLGITKASLQTRSFISAASFQETTRVLTEASVQGKRDKLVGLKENVIVGRLIPAGTGGATTPRQEDRRRPRQPRDRGAPVRGRAGRGAGRTDGRCDRHRDRLRAGGHDRKPRLIGAPSTNPWIPAAWRGIFFCAILALPPAHALP